MITESVVDETKLEKLKAGDEALFADVVREHHRALLALVVPLVGHSDAEEAVQNAWIKAHRALPGFEGRSSLRTWPGRIALNEAKMLLRKGGREACLTDMFPDALAADVLEGRFDRRGHWQSPLVQWDLESPDSLLMRDDLSDCLDRILEAMPTTQRAVLELRDTAGIAFEEICNELSISASNARVILHRARSQLVKLVDHYEETGEC